MSNSRHGIRFLVSTWLPVLIGILIIVGESTEAMGANHTSGPLRAIYEAIFGHVSDWDWGGIHHSIRKTGHFLGYGFIALAWLRAWRRTLPKAGFFTDALLALLGTALIASADEFHQAFLPNRTSSIWDVLLDCSGAVALQVIAYLLLLIRRPKALARAA